MKIIQVTYNFPPDIGGLGQHVWNLSNHLTKQGIEVVVITVPVSRKLHQKKFEIYPVYRVKTLDIPFLDPIPLNMFYLLRTLNKTRNINLLHFHGHSSLMSFFGAFFTRLLKIPYVVTDHGEGLPLTVLSRIYAYLRERLITKYVLKHSKKIISVNTYEVNTLIRIYGIPKNKIITIPNGVNTSQFNTLPTYNQIFLHNWRGKKMILGGGILAKWKGFEYLIRAMKLVVNKYENAHLVITGDGPDRSRLQDLVSSLGIEKYVTFLGYVEADLIPLLNKLSYMYILPSIYDVCPTGVLEAMASEKPVVVTSFGGQKELVIDGVSGFIVPPTNVKLLANAILKLLLFEELAIRMGKRGRLIIDEKFAWSRVSEKILQEYKKIITS